MTLSDDDLRVRLRRIDPLAAGAAVLTARRESRSLIRLAPVAAAVTLLAGAGVVVWASGDEPQPAAPLTLSVTPADGALGSCIPFSVAELGRMPVAFWGTVVAEDGSAVTLRVDRWYRGGDAPTVTLATPSGQVSLDGVEFQRDRSYLVAATGGSVNGCGFSGPPTPQLVRAYEEAFTG